MKLRERMEKLKQKQKGFTLVELIVVIAIIGILAGVMLPKYFGFTDNARESNALSEAKAIRGIYETLYAKSSDGKWPKIPTDDTDTIDDGVNKNKFPGTITAPLSGTGTNYDGSFKYVSKNGWTVECDDDGTLTTSRTTTSEK